MEDKKTPVYKKWLKYNDAFVRLADFKKMLTESKQHNDEENVRRISDLEKELKKIQSNSKKENKDAQTTFDKSNDSISLIPFNSTFEDSNVLDKTDSKTEYYENELAMSSPEKDDSYEAYKLFNDKMLSTKSPLERIEELPQYLADRCLIDGKKTITMNVAHMADKDDSQESYKQIDIMTARIMRGGDDEVIVGKHPNGQRVVIENPLPSEMIKVRNALINEHARIDAVIEKYKNTKHSKEIPSKNYQIIEASAGKTALQYKKKTTFSQLKFLKMSYIL